MWLNIYYFKSDMQYAPIKLLYIDYDEYKLLPVPFDQSLVLSCYFMKNNPELGGQLRMVFGSQLNLEYSMNCKTFSPNNTIKP